MKHCSKCAEIKPYAEFYKQGPGYTSLCQECARQQSRAYKEAHPRNRKLDPSLLKCRKNLTPIQRAARTAFDNAYKRAIRNGKEFNLTLGWVENAVEVFCKNNYHSLETRHPFRPSLDRIDRNQIYTPENVRVTWLIDNYAKNSFTDAQLIEYCKRKLALENGESFTE